MAKRLLAHEIDHDRAPALSWSSHGHALVMAAAAAAESQSLSAIEQIRCTTPGTSKHQRFVRLSNLLFRSLRHRVGVPHAVSLPRSTKPGAAVPGLHAPSPRPSTARAPARGLSSPCFTARPGLSRREAQRVAPCTGRLPTAHSSTAAPLAECAPSHDDVDGDDVRQPAAPQYV